jgi:hypothetical protein
MLAPLQAERQLLAIEASTVPHLKPEDARRVLERHTRILRPKEARAKNLTSALLGAGVQVVEVPAGKPSRKPRDETGRDKARQ